MAPMALLVNPKRFKASTRSTKQRLRSKKRKADRLHNKYRKKFKATSSVAGRLTTRLGNGGYKNITRTFPGIAPTEFNPGANIGQFISNVRLKTTPNGNGAFSYTFRLQDLQNYQDYTNIYQYYKINHVKVLIVPEQGPIIPNSTDFSTGATGNKDASDGTGKINGTACCLVSAYDRDTTSPFTSINEALAHEGQKMHIFNDGREYKLSIAPTPLGVAGDTGATYNVPSEQHWIPTTSPAVPHFGLRCWVDQFDQFQTLRVFMSYNISFKGLTL